MCVHMHIYALECMYAVRCELLLRLYRCESIKLLYVNQTINDEN